MSARKENDKSATLAYQALKAEFQKFLTAKNAGVLDENAEIKIIQKMVKERKESSELYAKAGRTDLADVEKYEYEILEKLLPAEPNDEDYISALDEFIVSLGDKAFDKSQMGTAIKFIKSKIIGADGKKCSQIVMSRLNS